MRALISPNENNRLCDVEAKDFPVAPPLFWVDCPDDTTPHTHIFDGQQIVIKRADPIPLPAPAVDPVVTLSQLKDAMVAAGISVTSVDAAMTAVKENVAASS